MHRTAEKTTSTSLRHPVLTGWLAALCCALLFALALPSLLGGLPLADDLGADSLRYLPVEAIARAIGKPAEHLCQACVTGEYPTECGQHLYQIALDNRGAKVDNKRTYEQLAAALAGG